MRIEKRFEKGWSTVDTEASTALFDTINELSPEECAKAWHELCSWDWPKSLVEFKPHWWDEGKFPNPEATPLSPRELDERKMGVWIILAPYLAARAGGNETLNRVREEIEPRTIFVPDDEAPSP